MINILPEEILKKINDELDKMYPVKEDKEDMLEKIGQLAYMETMEEILNSFTGENMEEVEKKQENFTILIENDKLAEAFEFAKSENIDIDAIFEKISVSVLSDALGFENDI
jgi:hypothetical protein